MTLADKISWHCCCRRCHCYSCCCHGFMFLYFIFWETPLRNIHDAPRWVIDLSEKSRSRILCFVEKKFLVDWIFVGSTNSRNCYWRDSQALLHHSHRLVLFIYFSIMFRCLWFFLYIPFVSPTQKHLTIGFYFLPCHIY